MPPAKDPGPDRPCVICGTPFTPQNVLARCCSFACQRERKRRAAAAWYVKNARKQIAAVTARRRKMRDG